MQGPTYAPVRPDAILLDFEGERTDISAYEAAGGYQTALAQAARPFDEFVQELKDSGLRGRGGAGFPTGMKVSFIGKGERFLVVNADESEPGTFKDRELMLRNPHALVEGCIMPATRSTRARRTSSSAASTRPRPRCSTRRSRRPTRAATSAPRCRRAGQRSTSTCTAAPAPTSAARRRRCCRRSTASAASRREAAVPGRVRRCKESPTLLNNVETVMTVPYIFAMGADRYQQLRTEQTTGTRMMSLSGHVQRPGNYELPVNATYRDLIEGCGGGVAGGRQMKCFIPGGSSAPILMPDDLDVQLAVETVRGGRVDGRVGRRDRDGRPHQHGAPGAARRRLLPARVVRQVHALPRGHAVDGRAAEARRLGRGRAHEIDLLVEMCDRIEGKCLCPLGDACAMPVRSYLKHFRHEFEACIGVGVAEGRPAPFGALYPELKRNLPLVPA